MKRDLLDLPFHGFADRVRQLAHVGEKTIFSQTAPEGDLKVT